MTAMKMTRQVWYKRTQQWTQHNQQPGTSKRVTTPKARVCAHKQRPEEAKFVKVLHLTHTTVCNNQHDGQHNHDDKHRPKPRPLIGHFFNRLNYCSLEKDSKVRTWNTSVKTRGTPECKQHLALVRTDHLLPLQSSPSNVYIYIQIK